jgi:hypothetical protein
MSYEDESRRQGDVFSKGQARKYSVEQQAVYRMDQDAGEVIAKGGQPEDPVKSRE